MLWCTWLLFRISLVLSLFLYRRWSIRFSHVARACWPSCARLQQHQSSLIVTDFCVFDCYLSALQLGPASFPSEKSTLKVRCCVSDALIKKSHFICIINATEIKRVSGGKTALNVQRNTKSLFFFIPQLLRRWPKTYLPFLRRGCHARGGGCLNWSCENTPCNNPSKQLASWTKAPTRSFWTTQRAANIFSSPFIFYFFSAESQPLGDVSTSLSKQNRFRMRWLVLSKCHSIPADVWGLGQ